MIYRATYRRPVRKVDVFHTSELSLPIFVPDECFGEAARRIRETAEKMAPEGYNLVDLVVFEEPKKVKKEKAVKEPETLRDRLRRMTPRGQRIALRKEVDKAFDGFIEAMVDYQRSTEIYLPLEFVCPICISCDIPIENATHSLDEACLPKNETMRRYSFVRGPICAHCQISGF